MGLKEAFRQRVFPVTEFLGIRRQLAREDDETVKNERFYCWCKMLVEQGGDPKACRFCFRSILAMKKSKHEAWKYFEIYKKLINNKHSLVPTELRGFEKVVKCQSACITLIAIRKFCRNSLLSIFPKDLVVMIAKVLWESRWQQCWDDDKQKRATKKKK